MFTLFLLINYLYRYGTGHPIEYNKINRVHEPEYRKDNDSHYNNNIQNKRTKNKQYVQFRTRKIKTKIKIHTGRTENENSHEISSSQN